MATKSADQWFAEYGESHRHPTNKAIHWICVPTIAACLLALLWEAPTPPALERTWWLNWATLLAAASLVFYVRLSPSLAVGMAIFVAIVVVGIALYERWVAAPIWQSASLAFVLAWVGQFIGHSIEGKKPSFFQDVQFLLIGPIWLLSFVYRRLGIPY
ncbi:MAG: hypothetical protein DCC67_10860 [Planctomycetota bacterium]|nr:MAG: hypothetical protein DCC67_10860 [Planctomycetota bacterium]